MLFYIIVWWCERDTQIREREDNRRETSERKREKKRLGKERKGRDKIERGRDKISYGQNILEKMKKEKKGWEREGKWCKWPIIFSPSLYSSFFHLFISFHLSWCKLSVYSEFGRSLFVVSFFLSLPLFLFPLPLYAFWYVYLTVSHSLTFSLSVFLFLVAETTTSHDHFYYNFFSITYITFVSLLLTNILL